MDRVRKQEKLPQDQIALIEGRVIDRWPKSDKQEASLLIDLMTHTPSKLWFEMIFKAERQEIRHWEMLLEHKERISSIAAEAVANEDGQVLIK